MCSTEKSGAKMAPQWNFLEKWLDLSPCLTVQDQPWSISYHILNGGPAIIKIKIIGAPSTKRVPLGALFACLI